MATNFPTSLDALSNPTGSSSLTSPDHAGQHADANDAIEAIQAKVGVNGSAVTTSFDYKISNGIFSKLNVDSGVLVVDDVNNRVGVNVSSPTTDLDVNGGIKSGGNIYALSGFTAVGSSNMGGIDAVGTITARNATNQDGIKLTGRVGGSSNYAVTFTPSTLTANRTLTLPDSSGTVATTSLVPAGCIMTYTTITAPSGWLLCDGSAVSRTTYAGLFAVIGSTYGVGDGSTTFNLPNLQGRVPVGKDAGTFSTIAGTGGVESVTLTAAQSGVPAHSHGASSSATSHRHSAPAGTNGVGLPFRGTNPDSAGAAGWGAQLDGGASTGYWVSSMPTQNESAHTHPITVNNSTATNASSAHTNLQPYLVLTYIIKT